MNSTDEGNVNAVPSLFLALAPKKFIDRRVSGVETNPLYCNGLDPVNRSNFIRN